MSSLSPVRHRLLGHRNGFGKTAMSESPLIHSRLKARAEGLSSGDLVLSQGHNVVPECLPTLLKSVPECLGRGRKVPRPALRGPCAS